MHIFFGNCGYEMMNLACIAMEFIPVYIRRITICSSLRRIIIIYVLWTHTWYLSLNECSLFEKHYADDWRDGLHHLSFAFSSLNTLRMRYVSHLISIAKYPPPPYSRLPKQVFRSHDLLSQIVVAENAPCTNFWTQR